MLESQQITPDRKKYEERIVLMTSMQKVEEGAERNPEPWEDDDGGLWAEECNGSRMRERRKEGRKEGRRKSEAICFQHRQKETSWWQGMRECRHEKREKELLTQEAAERMKLASFGASLLGRTCFSILSLHSFFLLRSLVSDPNNRNCMSIQR